MKISERSLERAPWEPESSLENASVCVAIFRVACGVSMINGFFFFPRLVTTYRRMAARRMEEASPCWLADVFPPFHILLLIISL